MTGNRQGGGGFIGGGGAGRRPRKPVGGSPTTGSGVGGADSTDCPNVTPPPISARRELAEGEPIAKRGCQANCENSGFPPATVRCATSGNSELGIPIGGKTGRQDDGKVPF